MRWRACVIAALGALTGCQVVTSPSPGSSPTPTVSPTAQVTTPSPTPTALPTSLLPADTDLTAPGMAKTAVAEILGAKPDSKVVKVDITPASATVAFLEPDNGIKALQWTNGVITRVDSDVADIQQAPFDPDDFDFHDVQALFDYATIFGASRSAPELQIGEYSAGQVLMTVTTRPESATVFFRADGSPITHVDFKTVLGLTEATTDALGQSTLIYAMGYREDKGLWVDTATTTAGTISRRIRPEKLPAYTMLRQESPSWEAFDPKIIDLKLLHKLMTQMREATQQPVAVLIDNHFNRPAVTITLESGSITRIYGLSGIDITDVVQPK